MTDRLEIGKQWVRLWTDLPNSAKIQLLPDHLFRFLINCWCLTGASKDDCLPDVDRICFALRIDPGICQAYIDHLIRQNLLTRRQGSGKIVPKNWDTRQFRSDSSKDRVRKSREKKKLESVKRDGNVTVTPSDTDTDTDTDTEQIHIPKPHRAEEAFDDQWQDFRRLYLETGKPLIEEDFTKAHFVWRVLDFGQRTTALMNLAVRKLEHDPQFIPKPERYLQGGEYARAVVARVNGTPAKKDLTQIMLEEERAKRA